VRRCGGRILVLDGPSFATEVIEMRIHSLRNLVLAVFAALLLAGPAGGVWQSTVPAGSYSVESGGDDTQCH
jgi:hypothetical protein